jgi:dienelactone hydrolase
MTSHCASLGRCPQMTDDFRPKTSARFARGALGEADDVEYRGATLQEFRLRSGTPCLLVRPRGTVSVAVVLAPSLRGHNGMFTELCLRLAQRRGWAVASPDFLPMLQGHPEQERSDFMSSVADAAVLEDLNAAAARLHAPKIALIGFCCGGMYAFKASVTGYFDAIVSFYGMVSLPTSWRNDRSAEPLNCLRSRIAPVFAIFGGQDPLISPEQAAEVKALGVPTAVFPEAGHAFAHDPSLASYRQDDAHSAWRAAAEFIGDHV